VSPWLIAACVVLAAVLVPLFVVVRRPLMLAFVALQLVAVLATVVLLLLAEGFHRTALFDPSLVLAVVAFAGALIFARLMAREL
jgi:multicomponent Na+:H+ antiporter subunit F